MMMCIMNINMFAMTVIGMFSATLAFPIQPINTTIYNNTIYNNTIYNCSNTPSVISPYGCCQDLTTVCVDADCSNCDMDDYNEPSRIEKDFVYDITKIFRLYTGILKLGGCEGTQFGCCHGTSIMCEDQKCSNCVLNNRGTIGGCLGTKYGCCADGIKSCEDSHCMNCPITQQYDYIIGGCAGTQYGCCMNTLINCIDKNCTNCRIYQTE